MLGSQLFVLFDLKKNNVVEFSEFVRALSVFHPKAPLEEKAECELSCRICSSKSPKCSVYRLAVLVSRRGQTHHIYMWQWRDGLAPKTAEQAGGQSSRVPHVPDVCPRRRAVAFRIYDLDRTGDIQPSEVARLLGALLLNNPDIALDDASIQKIVDQVSLLASIAAAVCAWLARVFVACCLTSQAYASVWSTRLFGRRGVPVEDLMHQYGTHRLMHVRRRSHERPEFGRGAIVRNRRQMHLTPG